MDNLDRDTETHWLRKADETRAAAEQARVPETRAALNLIGKMYECLAKHARKRAVGNSAD